MMIYQHEPVFTIGRAPFVAGAVGQPGERIFYLQATSSGRVTSVVLEKFQVSLLAERIDELLDAVDACAAALRAQGIGHGDRVTIYMPMIPEAAYAMLACARIGAIHSVVFAGFSVLYLKEPLGWNHALGFLFIAIGAFLIFHKWG